MNHAFWAAVTFWAAYVTDWAWVLAVRATTSDPVRAVVHSVFLAMTSWLALYVTITDPAYLPADLAGGALGTWVAVTRRDRDG
jgi:hypothetical protein